MEQKWNSASVPQNEVSESPYHKQSQVQLDNVVCDPSTALNLETLSVIAKVEAAAAAERKQKALRLGAIPPRSAQGDTSYVTEEERGLAHPALKGGAIHVQSLRDSSLLTTNELVSRMADGELRIANCEFLRRSGTLHPAPRPSHPAPRTSHLPYFEI
jgi:hypothetical protein